MSPAPQPAPGDLHVVDVPAREPHPEAEPYVLLHGWGCRGEDWDLLLGDLSRRSRVVTVDLPGHGQSPPSPEPEGYTLPALVAAVVAALDALGVGRAVLVGHSAGAEVAVALELAAPRRVSRLVVVDPAYGFAEADRERLTGVAERLEREEPAAVAAEYFLNIEGADTPAELVATHAASAAAADPGALRDVFRQFTFGPGAIHFTPDLDRAMARRGAPLLAVYRNDQRAEAGHRCAVQPGDEVLVFQGSGHWLHQEQPTRFLAQVHRWLARTPATPASSGR